jgi:hypothetical protein
MKVIPREDNYNICRIIKVTPQNDDIFREEKEQCRC